MFKRGITALLTMVVGAGVLSGGLVQHADATSADATSADATAHAPGGNGRIAYTKGWRVADDYRRDIFTVRPDGSGGQRLTTYRDASKPKWSPTGGRIAFERPGEVWVMKADGSDKQRLTAGELVGWMPVGGQVLVVRYSDVEGVDPTWLLHTVATGAEEELPIDLPLVADLDDDPYPDYSEWSSAGDAVLSPDGERLALMMWRYDESDGYYYYFGSIFTVRLDGTGLTRIPKYTYSWGISNWSPNSGQLLYWAEEPRGYCASGVRSLRLDGTAGSVDIQKRCAAPSPAWSPDGRRIVFTSGRSNSLQIASKDGTINRNVIPQKPDVYRSQPDWRAGR